jgi:anti-sigma factor RsiW
VIETLTDNHAILLLYLAGELPQVDRVEVQKRLAADPRLAAQLAELDAMHQQVGAGIAALDEIDRSRLSAVSAIDAAVASVGNWRFGPRSVQETSAPARMRIWAWIAPASLAASILIAAIIWIERRPATAPADNQIATATQPSTKSSDEEPIANDPESNLAMLQQSFATGSDEMPRRVLRDIRRDATPREDLSDYLLKTEVGQQ